MRARFGLKVLGSCALAMGAMAIGGSGAAQAEPGACWGYFDDFNQTLHCFTNTIETRLEIEVEDEVTLLLGNVNLEITCTEAGIIEGGRLAGNGSILLGRVEFSGCSSRKKTDLGKMASCAPEDPVGGPGVIRTEKGTGLIVLHNGPSVTNVPVVRFNDDPEQPDNDLLARILLNEECAFGEELLVRGELVLFDTLGIFTMHEHFHLMEEFPDLKLMTVGSKVATIDGAVLFEIEAEDVLWAGKAS